MDKQVKHNSEEMKAIAIEAMSGLTFGMQELNTVLATPNPADSKRCRDALIRAKALIKAAEQKLAA